MPPSSSKASQAMPLAPRLRAWLVSPSMKLRVKSPWPFTLMPRTTPPASSALVNTLNRLSAAMSLTSTMGRSKRRSGLSLPYTSMASVQGIRTKGFSRSNPLRSSGVFSFFIRCLNSFSRWTSTSS